MRVDDSVHGRLRRLEDEGAILDTLYAYGHALDLGSEELFAACWTDDALLVWPAPHPPYHGRAEILTVFRRHTHAPDVFHKHLVVEPRIELDGDRARVVSYYARLDTGNAGPFVRSFGIYRDVLVRGGDGRWRFSERRVENEAAVPGLRSSVEPA